MSSNISFERFLNVRSAAGGTFDADGQRLYFVSTTTGVPNLWGVRLDRPTAWPEPLVVGPERVQYAFAGPRPGRLVLGLDRDGDERTQLCLLDPPGARPRALTSSTDVIHHFGNWHPTGQTICYASNARDARFFDVYLLDVESGESRLVYQHDSTNRPVGFEPGGSRLLIERTFSSFEQELLLLDPRDGAVSSLTDQAASARYQGLHWAPDGRTIYCATDRESDFLALGALDPESSRLSILAAPRWDVEDLAVSPAGRYVAYVVNEDGFSNPYLHDLATGADRRLETPPGSLCYDAGRWSPTLSWSYGDSQLALSLCTATAAPDLWIADAEYGSARQVTWSWNADLPSEALVEPDLVRYPTFDGRQIPAFVYRPPGAPGDGSAAALFFVHGGPESQFQPGFNPVVQYFAHRGFVVVAPNVRGSTGYGKRYSHLDDVERRLDSVRDLAAGAEWLAATGQAHPGRIAVMGGSYGGYMVLAALTERPDLWAAGVDIVGIANFVTFLERTGPWRRRLREPEYGSLEHHRDLLERLSPLHRADQIVAPLMVVHGANDPRVPISEAEQIVESLRARGREVEYLRFEDEGHGLAKLENRLVAYPRIAEFLLQHLAR
jgi:dipeptidyl aminopeptidase/acylaminoacyl peptidase